MKKKYILSIFILIMCIVNSAQADQLIRCESFNGRRQFCNFGNVPYLNIVFSRKLSNSSCNLGSTWGYGKNHIWVDNGCRADFVVITRNQNFNQGSCNNSKPQYWNSNYQPYYQTPNYYFQNNRPIIPPGYINRIINKPSVGYGHGYHDRGHNHRNNIHRNNNHRYGGHQYLRR